MRYPMGITKQNHKINNYGNRGMSLESDLNETNTYYLRENIAVIYKKPTPITIAKVDYPSRKDAVIKEAYFKTPSTTDYNGIYQKRYLDFEAKETKQLRFPLSNIHAHQIEHLNKIIEHGGIGFLIVRFVIENKTYLLEANKLLDFCRKEEKKSIPIAYFKEEGYLIKESFIPRLDYLSIIDQIYFKGECI